MRILPRAFYTFVVTALLVGAATTSRLEAAASADPAITTPIALIAAQSPADAGRTAVQPRNVVRSRLVVIRTDQLPNPRLTGDGRSPSAPVLLDLFPDVQITAIFDRFDANLRGTTWVGHVDGVAGSTVTLVYTNGMVTGSIVTPGAAYSIRPAPGGGRVGGGPNVGALHTVSEIDQSAGRPEAPPIQVPLPRDSPVTASGAPPMQSDTADYIDVMAVYTQAAADYAGNGPIMESLVALAISESNTSYANSGIAQRLRLARVEQVAHTETDLEADLSNMQAGTGAFANIAAMRDESVADMVVLIQSSPMKEYCGIAFQMTVPTHAFADFAYSAVEVDCISPGYSFQHELGHNMGANHDWFVDGPATPSYAHGHVHTNPSGQSWTTIMSYFDLCTQRGVWCSRLLYWANPDIALDGVPMGVPAGTNDTCLAGDANNATCDADDRRRLNETALVVANFRSSPPPAAFSKDGPEDARTVDGSTLTLSWIATTNVDSYEYCIDTTFDATCDQTWMPVGPSLSAQVSGLQPSTAYNWQVRAHNVFGTTHANGGAWWAFSTSGLSLARYDPVMKVPRCGAVEKECDSGTALTGAGTMEGGPEPHQPNTIANSCSDSAALTFHSDESIDRIRIMTNDGTAIGAGKSVTIQVTAWIVDAGVDRIDIYYATNASSPSWAHIGTLAPAGADSQILSLTHVLAGTPQQAIRARLRTGGGLSPCSQTGFEDHDDLVFAVGPASNTNFATNGTFSLGGDHWSQFSTPDPTYTHVDTTAGLLQFYRLAPPPGTTNQAVVFQQTGVPLGTAAPIQATFKLGNTDSTRKRISVLIHDSDFSDLSVCTFWLGPGAPLSPYAMRTHTTRAWTNATISFYAASANAAGNSAGVYQVDDVNVQVVPAQSATETVCVDPQAPPVGVGGPGPDLILNGDFSGGLWPWNLFGQIAGDVVDGSFSFLKLAGAPAGVVFQITSQPVNAGEVLTATFELGNSSSVRKRVTAILHDSSFSDLSACTFWLAPGQPLSSYTYRTYVTDAWTSATLSIYPATTGPEGWILLDNATLARTPGVAISGTQCEEP